MRFSVALAALLVPALAQAVPLHFVHQGRLFDAAGAPLDGSEDLHFALYSTITGGTAEWEDTVTTDVDNGYFSVTLGASSSAPLTQDLFDADATLYLGMSVGMGAELSERLPLVPVPFAVTALNVSGGAVNATEVNVGSDTIINSSGIIDWSHIGNAPADSDTLATLSCDPLEITRFESGAWACAAANDHVHDASAVTTGILDVTRIPRGISEGTVAHGNHGHSLSDLTGNALPGDLSVGGMLTVGEPGACDSTNTGALAYNSTDSELQICVNDIWSSVWTQHGPGEDASTAAENCKVLHQAEPGLTDGAYWLDPDGTGSGVPFQSWCDMTTDGGGWTLALRAAPTASVFTFNHALWDSAGTLNDSVLDPTNASDGKFAAFDEVSGSEIRGCMKHPTSGVYGCKDYALPAAATLLSTFSTIEVGSTDNGKAHAFTETLAERNEWLSIQGRSTADSNCGASCPYVATGLNLDDDLSCYQTRVRFGMIRNGQTNINTADDGLGFGAAGYCTSDCAAPDSCWRTGSGMASNKGVFHTAGTIWIR